MKIAYYLPATIVSNSDLEKEFPDWNAAKIEDKIGVRERHISSKDETALDMAFQVSKKILAEVDPTIIDFVLLCTQSPDYFLPTSACILQDMLGLSKHCGALDFNLGCSGYIYGLAIAKGLLSTGIAHNILFLTSETYSKHTHPLDKANRSIFGDGATATILNTQDIEYIGEFELGTDGSGKRNLIVEAGGLRMAFDKTIKDESLLNGTFQSPNYLYMNGPEIFNFTIEQIPGVVESVLNKNKIDLEHIDYFIFHQANKYMLDYLRKKLKIPVDKFHNNILFTGNTVSSTIPIAIKDAMDENKIKSGSRLLLVGFGVGYSWGAVTVII
ncbi:MAG: ketoacyl-ACP synthase III [Alphaproteobacteria bacterium]|nr:ketoacyl-ACP synthase III [Alphaproteobacteria bacterium]